MELGDKIDQQGLKVRDLKVFEFIINALIFSFPFNFFFNI